MPPRQLLGRARRRPPAAHQPKRLNQQQQQLLHTASRSSVKEALEAVEVHWKSGLWLSPQNHYRGDATERIARDGAMGRGPVHAHLSEYVAVSAIAHCYDGWSFLGRAIEAELVGDMGTALHLAYYAELRAAMSILASNGVGVFKRKHVVIDVRGRCHWIDSLPTHEFAWLALEGFAASQNGVRALLNAVHPGGIPLEEWLRQYSSGYNYLSSQWIRQWGVDLSRWALDRDFRNTVSYRPSQFSILGPGDVRGAVRSVVGLWLLCEPGSSGGFPVLDRYLLRECLDQMFRNQHGRSPKQAPARFRRSISSLLTAVVPTAGMSVEQWEAFLSRTSEGSNPSLLGQAATYGVRVGPDSSRQVISRAFLLMRLATGTAWELLSQAFPTGPDLEPWLLGLSNCRPLWGSEEMPRPLTDLWTDVVDASHDLAQWVTNTEHATHHGLWSQHADLAAVLGTTERLALWGLNL